LSRVAIVSPVRVANDFDPGGAGNDSTVAASRSDVILSVLAARHGQRHNARVREIPRFADVAVDRAATLDVLALALAAEFREVDMADAIARLDALGADLARAAEQIHRTPEAQTLACGQIIGGAHGFVGDRERYDDPGNSMLDLVLTRRRGLPILLSVVYIEVARRATIPIAGVGLPGHFVVGHFGTDPPLLLDPFAGGEPVETDAPRELVRPWRADEIVMRMLNNLVAAYDRRGDTGAAIHAAGLRLALPATAAHRDVLRAELRAIQARLN
jgi:regulator of sirC expression with transglutaminase-like and TPR domain